MCDDEMSEGKYQEMMGLIEEAGRPEPEPLTSESIWVTKDKKRVKVCLMDDEHLLNTIRMLRGKSPIGTKFSCHPIRRREWLNCFANEAYSRGLSIEEMDEEDPVHE